MSEQIAQQLTDFMGLVNGKMTALDKKTTDFVKQLAEVETKGQDGIEKLKLLLNRVDGDGGAPVSGKTFGSIISDNEEFKAWMSGPKSAVGLRLSVDLKGIQRKAVVGLSDLGVQGTGVSSSERLSRVGMLGTEEFRVRDLIPVAITENSAVDFLKETSFTNAAYPQTEGSAKAESTFAMTAVQAGVKTVAHFLNITRQAIEDVGQLQAYLNFRLLGGLQDREDYELLRGDGSGQHVIGLMPSAENYGSENYAPGDTYLDKLSRAIENTENNFTKVTGIVLHRSAARAISRIKTDEGGSANTGNYLMGGPADMPFPMRIWGIPVALTNAIPATQYLVGDFVQGAQIFDRMRAEVAVSYENGDNFTKNIVTLRAEQRFALAIFGSRFFTRGSW